MSRISNMPAFRPDTQRANDPEPDQNQPRQHLGAHEDASPQLTISTDRARYVFGAEELFDEELTRRLCEDACFGQSPPVVTLMRLAELPDLSRRYALQLLRRLAAERTETASRQRTRIIILDDEEHCEEDEYRFIPCRYDVGQDRDFTDPFEAVLALMTGDSNLDRCERSLQTAIMAARVLHPSALELACNQIRERLSALGIRGIHTDRLIRQARNATLTEIAEDGEQESERIRDIIPAAPVPVHAVIPRRWSLSAQGIARRHGGPILIPTPVVISERLVDARDGAESLCLAWLRDHRWNERIVERTLLASSTRITKLSAYGIGVNSINARIAVQYFADFENENVEIIPLSRVTQQLGWQGTECEEGFLLGHELLTARTTVPFQAGGSSTGGEHQRPTIRFRGADEGDDQLVLGLHTAGTFDDWRDGISRLADYPKGKFIVCAAFSPPLLRPLQTPNFLVSATGATSQGKTTMLRCAASVWGAPDERSRTSIMGSWDGTRTYVERASAVLCDLPIILDDTQRSKNNRIITQAIYDVCSGRGRSRGSLVGIRDTDTFRTVLMSSGEKQLTSYSQDGGTRARVLELWGSPFERSDATTGAVVTQISSAVNENYGHAGRAWVQFLTANRSQWHAWHACHQQWKRHFEQRAGDNSVAARIGTNLATVQVAGALANYAGILPWAPDDMIEILWQELVSESAEAAQAAAMLRHVLSWAHAHREEFAGQRSAELGQPPGGWAGRWDSDPDNPNNWDYIGFFESKIDAVLGEGGYKPATIRSVWRDRGWLRISPGRAVYRTRLESMGSPVGLVAITRAAIESAEEAGTGGALSGCQPPPLPLGVVGTSVGPGVLAPHPDET